MNSARYTDDQLTPWFDIAQAPLREGAYELRNRLSGEMVDGWHNGYEWILCFGHAYEGVPLRSGRGYYQWRGLNFSHKPLVTTIEHGMVVIDVTPRPWDGRR